MKKFDSFYIILLLYVDGLVVARAHIEDINKLKRELSKEFFMKDLGVMKKVFA